MTYTSTTLHVAIHEKLHTRLLCPQNQITDIFTLLHCVNTNLTHNFVKKNYTNTKSFHVSIYPRLQKNSNAFKIQCLILLLHFTESYNNSKSHHIPGYMCKGLLFCTLNRHQGHTHYPCLVTASPYVNTRQLSHLLLITASLWAATSHTDAHISC
jgi:hypothetical protein